MNPIQIQNSLSGAKETLEPIETKRVRIYACGVTTYDHAHIGHAMPAIYFQMIRNYLRYRGYGVLYVRNYTDVDDKIIARASESGLSPATLAQDMINSYEEDMLRLGLEQPDASPRVSECIPDIIDLIEDIIANGAGYATSSGDVYFRVRARPDYGKLSNRRIDDLQAGARIIVQGQKEDELDFALWKNDHTPDASWPSPWGTGRPGWHIECSAMAKKYLGATFDIHGGGRDLIFPHHENEIAQSEAANKRPYAKVWMHSGLMTINQQKMSKSLGNHILIRDFLKEWPAEVLKYAILSNHYSSNIDFSNDSFYQSFCRVLYMYRSLCELELLGAGTQTADGGPNIEGYLPDELRKDFKAAMDDDFNSCKAIGMLNRWLRKANELKSLKASPARAHTAAALAKAFRETFLVLGLIQAKDIREAYLQMKLAFLPRLGMSESEVLTQIAARNQARTSKDFKTSDLIRDQMSQKGIELMDGPSGTEWGIRLQTDGI